MRAYAGIKLQPSSERKRKQSQGEKTARLSLYPRRKFYGPGQRTRFTLIVTSHDCTTLVWTVNWRQCKCAGDFQLGRHTSQGCNAISALFFCSLSLLFCWKLKLPWTSFCRFLGLCWNSEFTKNCSIRKMHDRLGFRISDFDCDCTRVPTCETWK